MLFQLLSREKGEETRCASRWQRCIYLGFQLLLIGGEVSIAPLQADTFWGAITSGNARQFEITCGTCPNPVTDFGTQNDGGFGEALASVEFSSGSDAVYSATAIFNGSEFLPHLAVLASGDIKVAPPSTFFYSASSTARATQQYTYIGTAPSDYTLEYNINGQVSGGILSEIAGGFTVFGSGFDPRQEVQPVLGLSFDHVNGDGSEKQVHLLGDVTFTVNPGDTFFVQSTLDGFVDSRSQQLAAFADASHTLTMQFTQGDTSLLIPAAVTSVSDVPEPVTVALCGLGTLGVGMAIRRSRERTIMLHSVSSRF